MLEKYYTEPQLLNEIKANLLTRLSVWMLGFPIVDIKRFWNCQCNTIVKKNSAILFQVEVLEHSNWFTDTTHQSLHRLIILNCSLSLNQTWIAN